MKIPRKKSSEYTREQLIGMIGSLRGALYSLNNDEPDFEYLQKVLDSTTFDVDEGWVDVLNQEDS